jgi:hypothetical protein
MRAANEEMVTAGLDALTGLVTFSVAMIATFRSPSDHWASTANRKARFDQQPEACAMVSACLQAYWAMGKAAGARKLVGDELFRETTT